MKRIVIASMVLMLVAAGRTYALEGPSQGGYVWVSDLQQDGNHDWYGPILECFEVDSNLQGVAGSFRTFSPEVPDNYMDGSQWGYSPGEHCGMPSLYEPSTPAGYGQLLMGVYADNDPGECMDILRLEPQADCSLTMVKVHDGKLDTPNEFHTQDATQALYDKDGAFCTKANSVLVVGLSSNMDDRTDGYATDEDDDGQFDGVGDSDTWINQSFNVYMGPKVMYKNYLYGAGYTSPGTGIMQLVRNPDNSLTRTRYYDDEGVGGLYELQGGSRTDGPGMAVGDPDGDGVPNVYVASSKCLPFDHDDNIETPDINTYGILWFEDQNADGVASDNTEYGIFVYTGDQNTTYGPDFPGNDVFRANGSFRPFAVVEGADGSHALLASSGGHWRWGVTYVALGIADNGEWSGEASVLATEKGPSGPWPKFADLGGNYVMFDTTIPEPGTILLVGTGLLGLLGYVRRRRMK